MVTWKSHSAVVLALWSGLAFGMPARADVKEVRIGVNGATCATCAFALRKAFKNLKGVADAQLTTKLGVMQVRMKPGLWPDLPGMKRTIREAGFEAKNSEVELVVTGTLRRDGEKLLVDLAGMKASQTMVVDPAAASSGIDDQLNQLVELKGHWKPADGVAGGGTFALVSVQAQK
jgi:hypothetical protein